MERLCLGLQNPSPLSRAPVEEGLGPPYEFPKDLPGVPPFQAILSAWIDESEQGPRSK